MEITKKQHAQFAKGYQAQHDDMFKDLQEHFSDIQSVILDHQFDPFKEPIEFEDFGRDAFIYKLEQYCKQVRLIRGIQGLTNSMEK